MMIRTLEFVFLLVFWREEVNLLANTA